MPDPLHMVITLAPECEEEDVIRDVVTEALEDLSSAPEAETILSIGFATRWSSRLADGSTLCRLVVDLEEVSDDEAERRAFANGLVSRLVDDTDRVISCVRFRDSSIKEANRSLADEIYELECLLREALTLVVASHNGGFAISTLFDEGTVNPLRPPNAEDLRTPHAENELFYILFSDYLSINNAKKLDLPTIIQAMSDHQTFDDFKRFLTRREVVDSEALQQFLAKIRTSMDPIEKVRNAVAHNRVVRPRLLADYHYAKKHLETDIRTVLATFE